MRLWWVKLRGSWSICGLCDSGSLEIPPKMYSVSCIRGCFINFKNFFQTAFRKWVQALTATMCFFFYILGILKPSLSSDDLTWDSITFPSHKLVRRWPSVAPSSVLTVPGLENLFKMANRRNKLENTPATNSETSRWFNVGIRKNQLTICNPMVFQEFCVSNFHTQNWFLSWRPWKSWSDFFQLY